MAQSPSMGATASDTCAPQDYRFSGFSYQNWDMKGEPPIMVNPKASLHHKLAWLWGEVATLNDALQDMHTSDNSSLATFANFIASRLTPMEAMLDHLGDITSKGAANV